MTTETPREIAHTAIIDILRKHKVMDTAIVAEIMPIVDEFGKSRWVEALSYAITFFRSLKIALGNMEHTTTDIITDLHDKGAK